MIMRVCENMTISDLTAVGVVTLSETKWLAYLRAKEGKSLNENGVLEVAVIPGENSNLPNKQVNDRHSKPCQGNAHISKEGRERQDHYVHNR